MRLVRILPLLLLAGCSLGECSSHKESASDTGQPATDAATQSANNRDYPPIALEMLRSAQQRIHIIEYVIYDSGSVQDLLNELVYAAQDRGVEVMVLADEAAVETSSALAFLSQYGIQAKLDSPNTTTHNKLIIADDTVMVGSSNFSTTALNYNNEANMFIADPQVAGHYEQVFQSLWADTDLSPTVTWSGDGPLQPLYNRQVAPAARACIDGATQWVEVAMYAMVHYASYPDSDATLLVESIGAALNRGVAVRVVLDGSEWTTSNHINDEAIDWLLAAGVELRVTASDVTTHAKLLICDEQVLVSDANWSYSSLELYNGTSVLAQDQALVTSYRAYFDTLWGQASPANR